MTEIQHLLACLAEEAGEIVQACGKALRFGLADGYPGATRTNAMDLDMELTHLLAIRKMLADRGVFPLGIDIQVAEDKEAKVRAYMDYAKDRGVINSR